MASKSDESFLAMCERGDLDSAKAYVVTHSHLASYDGYKAHPLLREFVRRNCGHCYKPAHRTIADLMIPERVRVFRDAVMADRIENVQSLLDRGANPNLGGLKHTPSASMAEALELLIRHGWDINERVDGRTLLHHDANHGHGGRVRLLLDHGADPNIKDAEDRTALHLVSARGVGAETIHALVDAGANLYARDHEGRTPVDHAASANRQAAFRALQVLGAQSSHVHG